MGVNLSGYFKSLHTVRVTLPNFTHIRIATPSLVIYMHSGAVAESLPVGGVKGLWLDDNVAIPVVGGAMILPAYQVA